MRKITLPLCALALGMASMLAPDFAAARTRHYYRHHAYRHYASHDSGCRARHARNGAIIGAVGGGIVANSMARGNRLPGTLLGAGVGALGGHAIGANTGC